MGEYTNLDMVKSLVRAVELLTEENKELRQELKEMRNNYGYCTQLTNEQKEELEKSCETCKYFCKSTHWCDQYNDTTYSTNCALYKNKESD